MNKALAILRALTRLAMEAPPSEYRKGYTDAIEEASEQVLDEMWENGVEEDDLDG